MWKQVWLRFLRAISPEASLLCTMIACPSLFTWGSVGFFSGCLRTVPTAITRASAYPFVFFCLSFFSSYSLPWQTVLACCNRLSKDWFGPYACFNSLWWISGADWVRNLYFKIILLSSLSGSISVNRWRASLSLPRNLPGASFYPCSMLANLTYFKVLAHTSLSPSRIHMTKWLCYRDGLTPSREKGYFMSPLSPSLMFKPFIS